MQDLVAASKPKSRLWLKVLCVILATFLLVAAVAYVKRDALAAWTAVASAEQQLMALKLSPEEQEAAMKPIRIYADHIRQGNVTPEQRDAVAVALEAGAVPVMLALLSFEAQYVRVPGFPEDMQLTAHKEIGRFVEGVRTQRIDREVLRTLGDELGKEAKAQIGQQKTTPAKGLPKENIDAFIAGLKAEADKAGILDAEFGIDLGASIQMAVDTGLNCSSEDTPTPQPESAATGDKGTTHGSH